MLEDRHACFCHDSLNERFAPSWNDQVNTIWPAQEVADRRPVGGGNALNSILRQAAAAEQGTEQLGEGQIGVQRLRTAAQDDGIAAFDAQSGGIHGDVRAGFVDEKDHTEGNADFADFQAVGAAFPPADFPHGVR